jgi:WD40 repeat protein
VEEERGKAERVKQIYERIVEEDAAKWSEHLKNLCGGDSGLEEEVAALLALTPQVVDFIEAPIIQEVALRALLQGPIKLGQRIGPYVLVEQVGQGGTGVVFRAHRADAEYQSEVAIKLVWPGFNREEVLRRFRQERQIQAKLQHPHIVRLLDGGTTEEGWPYIVMEFVEGDPLTSWAERQDLSLEERIQLFVQVCDAVAYAHRQQVVHRDLKPGNIFVTHRGEAEAGEIRLLDFGIAKILDSSGQAERLSLTQTGWQAMTPEYASPEQVLGREVTEASDLYSLGVVLYELLAGVHPLRVGSTPQTLASVLRAITDEEPPLPSLVAGIEKARLRGDLDSIIRKAMRKEPAERYRSVFDLRNDLMRHLCGQPVEARQGGWGYWLRKWLTRRKDLAVVTALAALVLVSLLWGISWWRARQLREVTRQAWQADYPRRLEQASQALEQRDIGLADRWLREDLSIAPGGGVDRRGFEWGLLWRRVHGEQWMVDFPGAIHAHTFSPEQEQLSVISMDRPNANQAMVPGKYGWVAARIDLERGEIVRRIKIDPQSLHTTLRWIWTGGWMRDSLMVGNTVEHGMRLWEFETGREIVVPSYPIDRATDPVLGHEDEAWPMPVLLPQQMPAARSGRFPLKGLGDWLVGRAGPAGDLVPLFIWQNPTQLVGKTGPKEMRIWDWETGRQLARLLHPSEIGFYLVDPDFHWVVIGGKDGELIVWDGKAIREQWRLTPEEGRYLAGQILSDPPRLVLGRDRGQLEVYDLPTGRRLRQIKDAHQDWINSILSLPRHGLVVTGSHDKTLRFWDARTFAPRNTLKGFQGEVHTLTSNPAEKVLVTVEGQGRRTLKGWNLDEVTLPDRLGDEDPSAPIFDVAISRDGRRIAAVSMNGSIRLWDLPTGALLWERKAKSGQLFAVAISPRGDGVAAAGEDCQVYLWESATGVLRSILSGHSKQIHGLAFSVDGRWLASASDDRTVRVWDPRSGQLRHQLTGAARELLTVAFHPEGGELAAGSADGNIHRWSLPGGRDGAGRRRPFEAHQGWVWSLQYSPDGKSLLSGSGDWTAAVWDLATGRRALLLKGHFDEIFAANFSPDGERITTVSNDNTVRVWDARSGQSLLTLRDHSDQVWGLALSPDGEWMATGGWDGQLILRHTLTREEVTKRLERSDRLRSSFATVAPRGHSIRPRLKRSSMSNRKD